MYVLADTADKTKKMHQEQLTKSKYSKTRVAVTAVDTLLWQAMASVIFPGYIINRLCAFAELGLSRFSKLSTPVRKWTVTGIGLASIPIIIKPVDHSVDYIMDTLIRPFY